MPSLIATSSPSCANRQSLEQQGYFIKRQLVSRAEIEEIRQALHAKAEHMAKESHFGDALLEPSARNNPIATPLHERFRKLNELHALPAVWNNWLAHPKVLEIIQDFLGQQILNKFASAFLKPALVGSSTPWHQDIGLWHDQNSDAMNAWLAIDPATKENGCLQCVAQSHRGEIVEHVMYDDSIHGEIPLERCHNLQVEHIELEPGDVVFWHSQLWHYSPPNTSSKNRMGCGAVWINEDQVTQCKSGFKFRWAMRDGIRQAFPTTTLVNGSANDSTTNSPEAKVDY